MALPAQLHGQKEEESLNLGGREGVMEDSNWFEIYATPEARSNGNDDCSPL